MQPELAKAALVFMSRVQLQGNEAPALMQVVQALEADANAAPAGANGAEMIQPKHEPETTEYRHAPMPPLPPNPPPGAHPRNGRTRTKSGT